MSTCKREIGKCMKTVNALGRYAWLTTAMRRRRGAAFTTKTHPQFSKSVSRKDENAVTQDAERKAVCVFSVWEEARRAVKYFLHLEIGRAHV